MAVEVLYHKRFLKDMAEIPAKFRKEIEDFVFDELPNAGHIADLSKFKKMSG